MSIEVTMPQMGESVVEGTVTKWLVSEGDRVQEDQPLCEISTDKVDTEIPSPGAGVRAQPKAAPAPPPAPGKAAAASAPSPARSQQPPPTLRAVRSEPRPQS